MVRITEETRERQSQHAAILAATLASLGSQDFGAYANWSSGRLQSYENTSTEKIFYRRLRSAGMTTAQIRDTVPTMGAAYDELPATSMAYVHGLALKEEGTGLFAGGSYESAIRKYKSAIRAILGDETIELPSPCYLYQPYLKFGVPQSVNGALRSHGDLDGFQWAQYVDIMALLGNIAACHIKLKNTVEAIDAILEFEQFTTCIQLTSAKPPLPAWKDFHISVGEYWLVRFKSWLRAIALFKSLGNTAVSASFGQLAMGDYGSVSPDVVKTFPKLAEVHEELKPMEWFRHRHPEPNISERHVQDPALQVLGIWERQAYAPASAKPGGRTQASTWIWHGALYVAGGSTDKDGPVGLSDMWRLDLKTRIWRRLPDIPVSTLRHDTTDSGLTGGLQIWNNKAYCFVGVSKIAVFDLAKETWSVVQTLMPRGTRWPYDRSGEFLSSFSTAMFEGVLYVFGGEDGFCLLGTNIFMALDLSTYRWTHISGTSVQRPVLGEPDLRTDPAMWAVPSERRIYIYQGSAKRSVAYLRKDPQGSPTDHTYGCCWSYHVDDREWRREKLRGNYASPRTEMAYCWSPSLQRTVIYGGYNSSLLTMDDSKPVPHDTPVIPDSMFQYAYFGDAFLFDPATRLWQHILVKGFPSYRAGSSFVCDPDSGKLYLFGGYTNAEYVPANRETVRMYGDLWQLKIDLPGGHWDPKDLERDIRLERAGPWMRCFTCGNCGINWQKCGGTCGGKLYFCSKDCQKNGWKEHKETHGCRKR